MCWPVLPLPCSRRKMSARELERASNQLDGRRPPHSLPSAAEPTRGPTGLQAASARNAPSRSEEHTSELQSRRDLVCRLLLEKKKKRKHSRLARKNKNKVKKII